MRIAKSIFLDVNKLLKYKIYLQKMSLHDILYIDNKK